MPLSGSAAFSPAEIKFSSIIGGLSNVSKICSLTSCRVCLRYRVLNMKFLEAYAETPTVEGDSKAKESAITDEFEGLWKSKWAIDRSIELVSVSVSKYPVHLKNKPIDVKTTERKPTESITLPVWLLVSRKEKCLFKVWLTRPTYFPNSKGEKCAS